jgi:hypothetical protein
MMARKEHSTSVLVFPGTNGKPNGISSGCFHSRFSLWPELWRMRDEGDAVGPAEADDEISHPNVSPFSPLS